MASRYSVAERRRSAGAPSTLQPGKCSASAVNTVALVECIVNSAITVKPSRVYSVVTEVLVTVATMTEETKIE